VEHAGLNRAQDLGNQPEQPQGEVLEQQDDLEQVRALLGHARMDTTQIYTSIRPAQPKRAVAFYETRPHGC